MKIDDLHRLQTRRLSHAFGVEILGVDLREVRRVGAPVVATVSLSLLMLLGLSVLLIRTLAI